MRRYFEVVSSDAGHFARHIVNDIEVWRTSQVYTRRVGAERALLSLAQTFYDRPVELRWNVDGVEKFLAACSGPRLSNEPFVHYADERTPPREPFPLESPFYFKQIQPIVDANTRRAHLGPPEDFWHDSDYHYRHCYDDDCRQRTPPVGTIVRGRIDALPYLGSDQ